MIYVALLRGINVGGKNKLPMTELKAVFEAAGMRQVVTYINSGNVVFVSDDEQATRIAEHLEAAIRQAFGLAVPVLVRSYMQVERIFQALPDDWANDTVTKCDILFLWDIFDTPEVVECIKVVDGVDDVRYVPGALLWRAERANVTRSGMQRIVGTDLYKHVTVRNCTTVRRIWLLMQAAAK